MYVCAYMVISSACLTTFTFFDIVFLVGSRESGVGSREIQTYSSLHYDFIEEDPCIDVQQ